MFKKVVIGHDGLAGGDDALALARALAPDAEYVLATCYAYDSTPSRFALLGYGDALREETEKALHKIRDAAGLEDTRVVAVADTSPARGLHKLAESEGADLLVVGCAHHGILGRVLLGDVARATLHGAPCPVAVAPRDFSGARPGKVGVACDNGPEAVAALKVAAELASRLGARLIVNDVVEYDLLPTIGGYPIAVDLEEIRNDLRDDAQKRLDASCAGLPGEIEAKAISGPVASTLDELAGEVDLMVCGSRGWGTARRVVLGSTADRLIHHAPCPVLVVPRTAEVAGAAPPAEATVGA